jgi:hypothetical protein
MSRVPATFKQRDVTRALKAIAAAGQRVSSIKINLKTGDIEVVTGNAVAQDPTPPAPEGNEWDTVLCYDKN